MSADRIATSDQLRNPSRPVSVSCSPMGSERYITSSSPASMSCRDFRSKISPSSFRDTAGTPSSLCRDNV